MPTIMGDTAAIVNDLRMKECSLIFIHALLLLRNSYYYFTSSNWLILYIWIFPDQQFKARIQTDDSIQYLVKKNEKEKKSFRLAELTIFSHDSTATTRTLSH